MKLRTVVFACLATMALIAPLAAQAAKFAAYEGKDSLQQGQGGTKIVKADVEFWTTGTPPHSYKVLGIISDKRRTGLLYGNAVGSSGIAEMVKKAGGHAAIVLDQNTQVSGAFLSNGVVGIARDRMTQLLVVRYEDVEPPPTRP